MLRATLTEFRVAGLLVAVEELLIGMPALASGIAAPPGTQLFAQRALLTLATISVTLASKTVRGGVEFLNLRGVSASPEHLPADGIRLASARGTKVASAVSRAAVSRFAFTMLIALLIAPTFLLDRLGHRFPAARLTQLLQQALVGVIDSTPLVSFKPGLQR